jgi:alkylation response protein AidB-like acyl-CoA dehydrogenase
MRFAFGSDQLELRDAVGNLLRDLCGPAVVRAAWEVPPGQLDRALWNALAEMGVFEVLVPESAGGLGLDWCALVLVLEEAGRAALPHPIVETAAVLAPFRPALPSVAGAAMVSAALAGEAAACGADCDYLVVDHESALWLLPVASVRGHMVETVDGARRLLAVDEVDFAAAARLSAATGGASLEAALDHASLGAAAQLLGLSQTMLDMTVAYVSQRQQFGVPVGSFQAVKHHLADALKELSFARPVVYRAAWSLSTGDEAAGAHVSMAKAMASEAAESVARVALQCHGAIGYAFEYDLHLFMKRAWALSRAAGTPAWHRQRVGQALLRP